MDDKGVEADGDSLSRRYEQNVVPLHYITVITVYVV